MVSVSEPDDVATSKRECNLTMTEISILSRRANKCEERHDSVDLHRRAVNFDSPIKIGAIETLICHARMRNWIFVKVVTDQPGLIGWGEATLEWHTRSVVGAIEDLATLLIGEDPTRVEHLWQMMHRQHVWHGNGVVRGTAIS